MARGDENQMALTAEASGPSSQMALGVSAHR